MNRKILKPARPPDNMTELECRLAVKCQRLSREGSEKDALITELQEDKSLLYAELEGYRQKYTRQGVATALLDTN